MKQVYIFLVIILLTGTSAQKKDLPAVELPIAAVVKKTDSLKEEYFKAAKSLDNQTDLLINQKKKLERENVILRQEVIRLKLLLSDKPDTVFLKQESFFRRLFKKKKKKKIIEVSNDY